MISLFCHLRDQLCKDAIDNIEMMVLSQLPFPYVNFSDSSSKWWWNNSFPVWGHANRIVFFQWLCTNRFVVVVVVAVVVVGFD